MKVTTIQVESKRKRFGLVANGLLTSLLISSGYVMTLPTIAISTMVGSVALLATATYAPSANAQAISNNDAQATLVDVTLTNLSASNITATFVSASQVTATNVTASNVTATNVSASAVTATNVTASNATLTNVTATSVSASNVSAENVTATNVTASNATLTNVTATNVSASNVTAANVTASNATLTNVTATKVSASFVTATNAVVSNLTAANVTAGFVTINNGLSVAPGAVVNFGGNRLQNVGNGVVATDGVNLGQLQAATTTLNRAIAGVAAMANIAPPTGMNVGEVAVGVGFGSSGGQTAVAVGVTGLVSPVLSYRFSIGTGTSSGGKAVLGGGMSYTFK